MSPTETQAPLLPLHRNRSWGLLWTASTMSAIGNRLTTFVLPIFALAQSGSPAWSGVIVASALAGQAVALIPAGAIVDRFRPLRVLRVSAFAQMCVSGVLIAAWYMGWLNGGLLLACVFLQGALSAFITPSNQSLLKAYVDKRQLAVARSLNEARGNALALIAPAAGAGLFAITRILPFIVDMASFGIQWMLTLLLPTPATAPASRRDKGWSSVTAGLRFIWSRSELRAVLIFAAIANLGESMLLPTLQIAAVDQGDGVAFAAAMATVVAASALVGALATGPLLKAVRAGRVIGLSAAVLVVGAVLTATLSGSWWVLVPLGVTFAGVPMISAVAFGYQGAVTPFELQGRVAAGMMFCAVVLTPLGPIIGAAIFQAWGLAAAAWCAAIVFLIAGIVIVRQRALLALAKTADW